MNIRLNAATVCARMVLSTCFTISQLMRALCAALSLRTYTHTHSGVYLNDLAEWVFITTASLKHSLRCCRFSALLYRCLLHRDLAFRLPDFVCLCEADPYPTAEKWTLWKSKYRLSCANSSKSKRLTETGGKRSIGVCNGTDRIKLSTLPFCTCRIWRETYRCKLTNS